MVPEVKINVLRKSVYRAQGFTTGLTDLIVYVRQPNGDLLTPNPTVVEQGDGAYYVEYTPDTLGIWQEKWISATNGDDVLRGIKVVSTDLADVKTSVDGVDTKVDALDGKVDTLGTKVDGVVSDLTSVKSTVETTDGKVDTINTNVGSVKTTVEGTDTKVDSLSTKLDSVESKVDALDLQIVKGGYFIV